MCPKCKTTEIIYHPILERNVYGCGFSYGHSEGDTPCCGLEVATHNVQMQKSSNRVEFPKPKPRDWDWDDDYFYPPRRSRKWEDDF